MSGPIMVVEDLCKDFAVRGQGRFLARSSTFRAVDGVSFAVPRGGTVAVVGESGSGKSTTARMLARLLEPTAGRIELDGEDVTHARGARLQNFRRHVQVVFQDPFSSLNPRHSVERIISAPLRYQGIEPPEGIGARVAELLERVGLAPEHARRFPHQFSGGQAQRIGIARALVLQPQVIVCDEAVSALDVSVQARVLELLQELQADLGLSYVFIAHDLAVVRQIADEVVVMQGGQVREAGPCESLFAAPQMAYTQELLAAVPRIPVDWERRRRENLRSLKRVR
ncbi:ATP-binding cassette domain-containing protein [Nocardioides sp. MH1]|uniref:ATP-binding cassette domain-containing protein n=1 Tax=Nocardioides sp. MH1 TaxID=3242490 RepID=UPI00351F8BAF